MTTKALSTTLYPGVTQDHTLVVGWEWFWRLILPEELLTAGNYFACALYNNDALRDPVIQATVAPERDGDLACLTIRLSAAETMLLITTPLVYAVYLASPDQTKVETLVTGRIDLMTPDEYAKSIRRVKYHLEFPNPFRRDAW